MIYLERKKVTYKRKT